MATLKHRCDALVEACEAFQGQAVGLNIGWFVPPESLDLPADIVRRARRQFDSEDEFYAWFT